MAGKLKGRVAIVTGGGTRLGRIAAEALGAEGAEVLIHYRTSGAGAEDAAAAIRARGGVAETFQAELRDVAEIERLFGRAEERFGGCDLLVNSAAHFERAALEEVDETRWRRMLDTNLSAPFFCCREAVRSMRRKGFGEIVNIVDIGGALQPWRGYAHYCASKAGLAMLTQCLALELAPSIRVNAIAPGTLLPPEATPAEELERLRAKIPQKRFGTAEELVETLLFLLAGPRYLTGQVLALDGGRSLS